MIRRSGGFGAGFVHTEINKTVMKTIMALPEGYKMVTRRMVARRLSSGVLVSMGN